MGCCLVGISDQNVMLGISLICFLILYVRRLLDKWSGGGLHRLSDRGQCNTSNEFSLHIYDYW